MIDREGVFKYFISSNNRTIVAINSLGLGVNTPSMDAVLHVGAPRSLKDYTQKNKKMGHNGKISQAVIFFSNRVNTPVDRDKAYRAALLDYIQREADVKICCRVVLNRYIDRKIQKTCLNCCTDSKELCDVYTAKLLDSQQVGITSTV